MATTDPLWPAPSSAILLFLAQQIVWLAGHQCSFECGQFRVEMVKLIACSGDLATAHAHSFREFVSHVVALALGTHSRESTALRQV